MKQLILNNKPTKNGRVYSTEILNKIASQINTSAFMAGTIGYLDHVVSVTEIAFQAKNAVVEENNLYAHIELCDLPKGKELCKILDNVVFRPAGMGYLNSNNEKVLEEDYHLLYIAAVPKETDAVNL